jgi:hypothetical protein
MAQVVGNTEMWELVRRLKDEPVRWQEVCLEDPCPSVRCPLCSFIVTARSFVVELPTSLVPYGDGMVSWDDGRAYRGDLNGDGRIYRPSLARKRAHRRCAVRYVLEMLGIEPGPDAEKRKESQA